MKKDEKEKARVRIFFREIEGADSTIVDGLRSFAQQLGQAFQPDVRVIKLISEGNGASAAKVSKDIEAEILAAETHLPADDVEQEPSSQPKKERPKAASKGVSYTTVKNLDFRPDGKQSLRDFYTEKQPPDQQSEVLLVLHYLHRIMELNKITADHVYTGLLDLSEFRVKIPLNIVKILRQLATRKGYADTADSDDLKMTTQGDNYIKHDLPATKGGRAVSAAA